MSIKDSLGDRMKDCYENRAKTYLTRRTPVIVRIDGKSFHTFTKNFKKPFDEVLIKTMQDTTQYLCKHVMGCVLGYTQSDEITLVLQDYKTLTTEAWFDYGVQKVCSIAASMATLAFNKAFEKNVEEFIQHHGWNFELGDWKTGDERALIWAYTSAIEKGAMFDARCFNIPFEEVTNCLIWRQQDASRNSVEMLGRAYFSHKELDHKNVSNIQDMLIEQHNVNWNDLPTEQKRGSCCIKVEKENGHSEWIIDHDIPIFTQDRDYLEKRIKFEGD